jgi:hypothetical protein
MTLTKDSYFTQKDFDLGRGCQCHSPFKKVSSILSICWEREVTFPTFLRHLCKTLYLIWFWVEMNGDVNKNWIHTTILKKCQVSRREWKALPQPNVKHCLDFSFVFSALLPPWRNLFSVSGIFCSGRYQPGYTGIFRPAEGTSQPLSISKGWKVPALLYVGKGPGLRLNPVQSYLHLTSDSWTPPISTKPWTPISINFKEANLPLVEWRIGTIRSLKSNSDTATNAQIKYSRILYKPWPSQFHLNPSPSYAHKELVFLINISSKQSSVVPKLRVPICFLHFQHRTIEIDT